jgi:BirA family biotin operon repressor/biotin-[acetyl-CoA-carboxylase] ligase
MTDAVPTDLARALSTVDGEERLRPFITDLSYFETVPSTNDIAMKLLASGAPDGTTVLAGRQTAGRGRRGRNWFSPEGAGLYVSVVLRDVRSASVTLLAGVAAAEGLRAATHVPVDLEWPNDLVVTREDRERDRRQRAKVGGILCEGWPGDTDEAGVVVGIGVNVVSTAYPADIASRTSSLEALADRAVDRWRVLVELLASLAMWRERYTVDGGVTMLDRWRALSPSSAGTRVAWKATTGERHGVTDGIEADGSLRVRSDGQLERIVGGAVTWLPDLDPFDVRSFTPGS